MRLQFEALKNRSADADQQAVKQGILPVCRVLMRRPTRDSEPEPSGEGGQSERQHEAIVETIGKEEKEKGRGQEIEIPLSGKDVETVLQISEFYTPDEAAEVEDIVEDRSRCSRLRSRPGWRAGEAIPETGGEDDGENGQDEYIAELLRPGGDSPAKSGNERQHTGIEEKVELKREGEGFSAREAR